jgi:hypothetical protein
MRNRFPVRVCKPTRYDFAGFNYLPVPAGIGAILHDAIPLAAAVTCLPLEQYAPDSPRGLPPVKPCLIQTDPLPTGESRSAIKIKSGQCEIETCHRGANPASTRFSVADPIL